MHGQFLFHGKAVILTDNIDTDAIIPAVYLNLTDERELASHCMEEIIPGFCTRVNPGDILIAGDNFGCGSSREHAPLAIRGCGISCVIAKSFSRLFYRNAINIGLPVVTAHLAPSVKEGDDISVDCHTGKITVNGADQAASGTPLPAFMLEILQYGGLAAYLEALLQKQGRL